LFPPSCWAKACQWQASGQQASPGVCHRNEVSLWLGQYAEVALAEKVRTYTSALGVSSPLQHRGRAKTETEGQCGLEAHLDGFA
jgi:hypothetical protein